MATSIPLPAGLSLDAASWAQTPLVVRQMVVHLLAVIQQQAVRIAALDARVAQNSRNSDRPPASDPPYEKRIARSGTQGKPGAKPGHPGHRQALLVPTEVLEVKPAACPCGQRDSRSAVQEFCTSVLGVRISRGAIQRCMDRVSEAIQPLYEAIAQEARSAPVSYIDETPWYQHGVLAWLWVMANPTVALFKVQASRNKMAFAALIERWAGFW